MADIFEVVLTEKAKRNLQKVPKRIAKKFRALTDSIREIGIRELRKTKSLHDEPLQGIRFGQRSIRLNKSYRAFYIEKHGGIIELIEVLEINKHDY